MNSLHFYKGRGISFVMRIIVCLMVAGLIGEQGPLLCFGQPGYQGAAQNGSDQAALNQPLINRADQQNLISMDFQDVSLKEILKVFSQQSGLNFVASDKIQDRKVTLFLDKVNVKDALNTILAANSLTFEQRPGTNIFAVKEILAPELLLETRVYRLGYAAVSGAEVGQEKGGKGVEDVVKGLLTKDGKLITDPRTNSLIVTDIPESLDVIEKTLGGLDIKTPQVMISAEVLEVSIDTLKRIGIEWGSDTGQFANFVAGSRSTFWPFKESLFKGAAETAAMGSINFNTFTAVLKAIKTDASTVYLARPRLLTLNNEAAEVRITKQASVATNTITTGTTAIANTTTSLERYEVGTILKVTPHINKDDYITMTVEPEVSRVKVSSWSSSYFDPFKRTAKTTIRIKDGETIVIAGLISREDSDSNRKVPLFGEVPIFGNAFKRDEKQRSDTEILIFITPHIIKEDGAALAVAMQDELDLGGTGPRETSFGFEQPKEKLPMSKAKKKVLGRNAHKFHYLVREQESPLSNRELIMEAEILKLKSAAMPIDKKYDVR